MKERELTGDQKTAIVRWLESPVFTEIVVPLMADHEDNAMLQALSAGQRAPEAASKVEALALASAEVTGVRKAFIWFASLHDAMLDLSLQSDSSAQADSER